MNNICLARLSGALVIAVFCANLATASITNTLGSGFTLADNDSAGSSSVISIGVDETISNVEVTLSSLTHTWVGDLIARISSPSGTTVDLFFRVGNGNFGDNSNLDGDYTFADGGADWGAEAGSVNNGQSLASGTYQAATDGEVAVSLADAFSGESTLGDWTLFMSDNANRDLGSLGSWGISITSTPTAIPEPDAMLLLLIGTAIGVQRRRRRSC